MSTVFLQAFILAPPYIHRVKTRIGYFYRRLGQNTYVLATGELLRALLAFYVNAIADNFHLV